MSGPAGRLMAAAGLPISATGVARAYGGWLDVLVFDEQDRALAPEIRDAVRDRFGIELHPEPVLVGVAL